MRTKKLHSLRSWESQFGRRYALRSEYWNAHQGSRLPFNALVRARYADAHARAVRLNGVVSAACFARFAQPLRVFIYHQPLAGTQVIKFVKDVRLTAEPRGELAGGDVPTAVKPDSFLPAREVRQDFRCIRDF